MKANHKLFIFALLLLLTSTTTGLHAQTPVQVTQPQWFLKYIKQGPYTTATLPAASTCVGCLVYNGDIHNYEYSNGTVWSTFSATGGSTVDSIYQHGDSLFYLTPNEVVYVGQWVTQNDSTTIFVTPTQLNDTATAIRSSWHDSLNAYTWERSLDALSGTGGDLYGEHYPNWHGIGILEIDSASEFFVRSYCDDCNENGSISVSNGQPSVFYKSNDTTFSNLAGRASIDQNKFLSLLASRYYYNSYPDSSQESSINAIQWITHVSGRDLSYQTHRGIELYKIIDVNGDTSVHHPLTIYSDSLVDGTQYSTNSINIYGNHTDIGIDSKSVSIGAEQSNDVPDSLPVYDNTNKNLIVKAPAKKLNVANADSLGHQPASYYAQSPNAADYNMLYQKSGRITGSPELTYKDSTGIDFFDLSSKVAFSNYSLGTRFSPNYKRLSMYKDTTYTGLINEIHGTATPSTLYFATYLNAADNSERDFYIRPYSHGGNGIYDFAADTTNGNYVGTFTATLTSSNSKQRGLAMFPYIHQSGTAGYDGLLIAPVYDGASSFGSGNRNLISAGTSDGTSYTEKFAISDSGSASLNSFLKVGTFTGAAMNAITSPATGMIVYCTDSAGVCIYNGSAWRKLATSVAATYTAGRGLNLSGNSFSLDTSKNYTWNSQYINDNLGIGTTSPTHSLTLGSTATGIASYNTTDQTTNYERVVGQWNSNVYTLGTYYGGSGTSARSLQLGIQTVVNATTLGGRVFTINQGAASGSGIFDFNATSTGSGPSINTFNSTLIASSSTQNMVSIQPRINQSGTAGYSALLISPYEQSTGSGSNYLINAGTSSAASGGGTFSQKFAVTNAGVTTASQYRLSALNTAPSSATDAGTAGEVRITATYIYVCTAANTWVRAALSTW